MSMPMMSSKVIFVDDLCTCWCTLWSYETTHLSTISFRTWFAIFSSMFARWPVCVFQCSIPAQ